MRWSLARDTSKPETQAELLGQLSEAADKGLATALYLYGMRQSSAASALPQDRAKAANCYRQAAEKGHRGAQARWGFALMEGTASRPTRWRANPGCAAPRWPATREAAALVGDIYAKGGSLPPNYAEAAMWFRRAADASHRGAARALGMLLPDRRRRGARPG